MGRYKKRRVDRWHEMRELLNHLRGIVRSLDQYPFAAPFDELVKHHAHIGQSEAAHVEAKELGRMPRAEF